MLANKVALVTGDSGIGAATARVLSAAGASVVLTGRDGAALKAVADSCATPTKVLTADLAQPTQIDSMAAEALSAFGSLDILVNNAGIIEKGSLAESTEEQLSRVMQVNLGSVFQLTRLCLPALKAARGSIVGVSSVNGMRAFPGLIAYNVSKAALDQFTRCLALELAADGVRVNSVNPGVTRTSLHNRGYAWAQPDYAAFLRHSETTHALGRVGEPEEVAEAILWLASPKSSFTTGASIPVDGGRHAMCPR